MVYLKESASHRDLSHNASHSSVIFKTATIKLRTAVALPHRPGLPPSDLLCRERRLESKLVDAASPSPDIASGLGCAHAIGVVSCRQGGFGADRRTTGRSSAIGGMCRASQRDARRHRHPTSARHRRRAGLLRLREELDTNRSSSRQRRRLFCGLMDATSVGCALAPDVESVHRYVRGEVKRVGPATKWRRRS